MPGQRAWEAHQIVNEGTTIHRPSVRFRTASERVAYAEGFEAGGLHVLDSLKHRPPEAAAAVFGEDLTFLRELLEQLEDR